MIKILQRESASKKESPLTSEHESVLVCPSYRINVSPCSYKLKARKNRDCEHSQLINVRHQSFSAGKACDATAFLAEWAAVRVWLTNSTVAPVEAIPS